MGCPHACVPSPARLWGRSSERSAPAFTIWRRVAGALSSPGSVVRRAWREGPQWARCRLAAMQNNPRSWSALNVGFHLFRAIRSLPQRGSEIRPSCQRDMSYKDWRVPRLWCCYTDGLSFDPRSAEHKHRVLRSIVCCGASTRFGDFSVFCRAAAETGLYRAALIDGAIDIAVGAEGSHACIGQLVPECLP